MMLRMRMRIFCMYTTTIAVELQHTDAAVISPHRKHCIASSARCELLLQMSHVVCGLCVHLCMFVTTVSCAKTAEPIEMPFVV